MTPLWSVVLIARNEARTLPRLMASLREFQTRGGEVVLVDTGSTDNSPDLARSLGCRVEEVGERFVTTLDDLSVSALNAAFVADGEPAIVAVGDRLFDYSAARNYAATLATNDMVSMPDCDEEWTRLDIDAVNAAIAGGAQRLEYNFVFAHDEFGGEAVKFAHSKFYDRRKLRWVGIIHEVLAGDSLGMCMPETVMKLEHWQNPASNRRGYLPGLALDCHRNPDNDRNLHYLGRELMYQSRPRSALRVLERHVAMNRWPEERAQSVIYMGDCHAALGETDAALAAWARAYAMDGSRREALMRLASHYYRAGDAQRTAAYAAAALTIPWSRFYCNRMEHYTHEPHEILYWSLYWLGDKEGSRRHWEAAIRYQPLNPRYQEAGQFYVGEGRLALWTWFVTQAIPFSFVKIGDGEEQAMAGAMGGTCDGQAYGDALGAKLRGSFKSLRGRAMVQHYRDQAAVNTLLHRDDTDLDALHRFYAAVRESGRVKAFVGPLRLAGVAQLFKCPHIMVTEQNAFGGYDNIWERLKPTLESDGIYLFSAGPTAKCLIADVLATRRDVTCLDLGSAFDSLFVGWTRTHQTDQETMMRLYSGELWFPTVSVIVPTLGREAELARLLTLIPMGRYGRHEVHVMRDDWPPNNQGVPRLVADGVAQSKGELVMYLSNDCVPEPGFMMAAVLEFQRVFPDRRGLLALNDGYWNGEFATHWIASRSLLPDLDGEFFHTGYHHCGCDNELSGRAKALGCYAWAQHVRVGHQHPVEDAVHKLAYDPERVAADRALLKERAARLAFEYVDHYEPPSVLTKA